MKSQKDSKIRRKNDSPPNYGKQGSQTNEPVDQKALRNFSEDGGFDKVQSNRVIPLFEEAYAVEMAKKSKKDCGKVASQMDQFEELDKTLRKPLHPRPQDPTDLQDGN